VSLHCCDCFPTVLLYMNRPFFCYSNRLFAMVRKVHLASIEAAGDLSSSPVVAAAVAVLSRGGVVALPSDTLYGVTSTIDHSQKLFEVKRRSQLKPLGLFVAGPREVKKWAKVTISDDLLYSLLPGPVTLMFNRLPSLPESFNPDTLKVGVRVPLCPIVNEICSSLGAPLAQTSANPSGSPLNPICVDDFTELHDEIDLIIDGGRIETTAEGSTIIDLSQQGFYRIVRDGCALYETRKKLEGAGLRPLFDPDHL
ncbi:hypothetical protein PFISCL1PPCAC_5846, partial [Pristionchus fissidentatus]